MTLTEAEKRKIREEEKYRHAVASSISGKTEKSSQKHGVPLILSIFVPGLGQLVKGQVKKAAIIFFTPIGVFVFLFIMSFIAKNSDFFGPLSQLFFIWIFIYIWQLIDAYNN